MKAAFVPVIHSADIPDQGAARPDEDDTLFTVKAVVAALQRQGYRSEAIRMDFDLNTLKSLGKRNPLAVFNLVEAFGGDDALSWLPCPVLDHLGMAYTGARSEAQFMTQPKLLSKRQMHLHGLPTADWWEPGESVPADRTVIIKSVSQHASRGMDSNSIVSGDRALKEIAQRENTYGGPFFAEAFVPGREFNLSIMETLAGPQVLPIPEIRFDDLPPGRPHIVDWEAKWDDDAPAYYQTDRFFGLEKREPELAAQLTSIATKCWEVFHMNGYARVDFRVDEAGQPYVLEINTNPCLAPDAGFAMAAAEAGISYDALVQSIVEVAVASFADSRKQVRMVAEKTTSLPSKMPKRKLKTRAGKFGPAATSRQKLEWRSTVTSADFQRVRQLVVDTGMFTEEEAAVAQELVIERVKHGAESGYEFILAERAGELMGYACYGPTPLTDDSFDLYWIVVNRACQGQGLGRQLLQRVEQATLTLGGHALWVDTSSTEHYMPTRAFYHKTGFEQSAELKNFYRDSDNKVIFVKHLHH